MHKPKSCQSANFDGETTAVMLSLTPTTTLAGFHVAAAHVHMYPLCKGEYYAQKKHAARVHRQKGKIDRNQNLGLQ